MQQQTQENWDQICNNSHLNLTAKVANDSIELKLVQTKENKLSVYSATITNISEDKILNRFCDSAEQVVNLMKQEENLIIDVEKMKITLQTKVIKKSETRKFVLFEADLVKVSQSINKTHHLQKILQSCNKRTDISADEIKQYFQIVVKQIMQLKQQKQKQQFVQMNLFNEVKLNQNNFLSQIKLQITQTKQLFNNLTLKTDKTDQLFVKFTNQQNEKIKQQQNTSQQQIKQLINTKFTEQTNIIKNNMTQQMSKIESTLNQLMNKKVELLKLQLSQIQKVVTKQVSQMRQIIKNKQQQQQQKLNIRSLLGQQQQQQLQQQIKLFKQQLSNQIQNLKNKSQQQIIQIKQQLNNQNTKFQQQINQLKQQIKNQQQSQKCDAQKWVNPECCYQLQFQDNKITSINDDANVFGKQILQQQFTFTIKFINIKQSVYIGIVDLQYVQLQQDQQDQQDQQQQKQQQNNDEQHPNSIYYYNNARLFQSGNQIKKCGSGFKVNDVVCVSGSLKTGIIKFIVNDQLECEHQFDQLKNNDVKWVPYIRLLSQEDSFEIID